MKPRLRKYMLWASTALVLYAISYGVVRWRKFVVMREYCVKEERVVVRRTGAGFDIRENWRGRLKNRINPALFMLFRPAEFLEDRVRGGVSPIPSNHAASGNGAMPSLFHIERLERAVPEPPR